MCRADLNFEVDFGVNGAIGTIVTKWDSDNASFSPINFFFFLTWIIFRFSTREPQKLIFGPSCNCSFHSNDFCLEGELNKITRNTRAV